MTLSKECNHKWLEGGNAIFCVRCGLIKEMWSLVIK